MYFGKPPRIYVLTRTESDCGIATCPKCGEVLETVPFTKQDKLYRCVCGFHIPKSSVVMEYKMTRVSEELKMIAKELVANKYATRIKELEQKIAKVIKQYSPLALFKIKYDNALNREIVYFKGKPYFSIVTLNFMTGSGEFGKEGNFWLDLSINDRPTKDIEIEGNIANASDVHNMELNLLHWLKKHDKELREDFHIMANGKDSSDLIREIKDFIKNSARMEPEEDNVGSLLYATRDHGDVGEETPGQEDINKMKTIGRSVIQKFGTDKVKVGLEAIDEWVHLTISLK